MGKNTEKEYLVSIITPFHNVNIELFRRGYESLKEQTIGFSNIQWIVVLHNTEPKYHEAVHQLLDGQENVAIKALDNDAHTPSSPRNYGMKFATAPYIGFLDGDDSYTPKCLQTAVHHIKRTDSQMVVFRREFESGQGPMSVAMAEIVLWDQTREEIVIDREHWEDEKMFSGIWGMVTSRLFDRAFLEKYGITFDEDVPFTEDNLFLIEAYGKLQRVCYLPQFIGYHYFIHDDSLVQSVADRTGAELVSYAKGFRKIFDTALRNGVYIDWFMPFNLTAFASAMVRAKHLTLADRQEIKEILEPYVHKIRLLPVNKLTTENDVKAFYEIPREVILNPENFDKGAHMQSVWNGQNVLDEILQKNKNTDYGLRYHFEVLRAAEGYQARVPLSHYDIYEPLVELQTKAGESGIFVAEPIECYLLSSGSMGTPRLIPATRTHLQPYLDAFTQMVRGKTTFLLAESLPMRERYNDRSVLNSISGMVLSSFLQREHNTMHGMKAKFTSPEPILCPPEAMDILYLRLLFALKERDVEQIVAPFTWGVVEALSFMEKHWENLCDDIEKGKITFALDVSESFQRQISGLLNADKERAEELRRAFSAGFDSPIVPRIWLRLKRVIAAGTGSFRIYTRRMKRYTGDIPHSNGFFASSEALIGKALEGTDDYELLTGTNFYEFLPLHAKEGDAPLLLSQVKAGCDCELIVTNQAGFYRYCTGDLIHVKDNRNGRMVFSPIGRRHQFACVADALLREDEIYTAIVGTAEKYGAAVADFVFFVSQEGGEERLTILLESEDAHNNVEMFSHADTEKIAASLDEALCCENAAYAAVRGKACPSCRLRWLQPQTQLLYRDLKRFRMKTAPDQIKPVHFLNTPANIKFFTSWLEQGFKA